MNPLAVMSLASLRVQASAPSAPPSAPQVASPGVSHHLPLYEPAHAPRPSTTARMPAPSTPGAFTTTPSDAPVVIPSVPPLPSAPPPSPAASVRYERAFRSWSYSTPPPSEVAGDAEASQGPLTYQVYTAQDIAVAPRASRMNFANAMPAPVPLHKRVGMMITGAAIVLCTAAAVILGVVDDGPKAPRESAAASMAPPPVAIDDAPVPDPASVTTTTSFIPPVVTIVDDPNAQPAPAPRPKKKKVTTDVASASGASAAAGASGASGSIINVSANAANAPAPPPNPYAVSKK